MITITAFQIGSFQFTGFQEAQTVSGSGGWLPYYLDMLRRARAKAKPKEIEREKEPELQYVALPQPFRFIAKPIYTDLSALAARISPPIIDEQEELAEFRAFMETLVAMEEA